jgi:hypothetical protein
MSAPISGLVKSWKFSNHVPFVQEIVILLWPFRHAKTGCFIAVMMRAQMSIAFATSHCCMMQTFIKQKLNARAFFHNNWHEVKYIHEAIHAGSYTSS